MVVAQVVICNSSHFLLYCNFIQQNILYWYDDFLYDSLLNPSVFEKYSCRISTVYIILDREYKVCLRRRSILRLLDQGFLCISNYFWRKANSLDFFACHIITFF